MSNSFNSDNSSNGNKNVPNRTRFPFILMPVSNVGENGNSDSCNLPSVHLETPLTTQPRCATTKRAARRNTVVQKELRSRFPLVDSSAVEPYMFPQQEHIRRSARSLYPPSSTISQTSIVEDGYVATGARATLLFNGIQMPREQIQAARSSHRNRNSDKFRTSVRIADAGDVLPVASVSTSTPQLVVGRVAPSEDSSFTNHHTLESNLNTKLSNMESELQEKEKEILLLKTELIDIKKSLEKSSYETQTNKAQQATLRHEISRMEDQISTLEERLENHDELNVLKEFINAQVDPPNQFGCPRPPFFPKPDFDRLVNMIRELNAIAGNYHSVELCYTSGGATFKPPEAIVLTLYNNGLMLDDEPFRPFDDVATAQFIQDINDGYFPTELQAKYPGGITLVVKDRRNTAYPGDLAFKGKGRKLNERLEFLPKFYPGMKFTSKKQQQSSLHECSSAESTISKSNESREVLYEQLPDLIRPSISVAPPQRSLYKNVTNKLITLKLRHLKAESAYKLKTTIAATPDDILVHLETHLDSSGSGDNSNFRKYELINSFPFGIFSLGEASLKDYGITSNTLVYFRTI